MTSVGIMASGVNLGGGCTDVLSEPFDNIAIWSTVSGTPTIAVGRTANAVSLDQTDMIAYNIAGAAQSDVVTVGFAWRCSDFSGASRNIFELRSDSGATLHNTLDIVSTTKVLQFTRAAITVASSAATVIALNTYAYIEVQAKLHDTTGYVIVRVNGTEVINATALDTRNAGTKIVYDQLRLMRPLTTTVVTGRFDDLYISTGSGCAFKGDQTIVNTGPDVLLEPFNNVTAWSTGFMSSVTGGRTGNMGQLTGASTGAYMIPAAVENATITIGFAFKISSLAADRVFLYLNSDTNGLHHESFLVTTAGGIEVRRGNVAGGLLGTTATGLVAISTWNYFEAQVLMHDTAGTMVVRLNGTEILNLTGVDTKAAGTKAVYDSVELSAGGSGTTHNFDDLYITMGAGAAFKGDITIP